MHTDGVDVALCWGWVDGLINKYDDESYVVRYTPRRGKSMWSKINVAKVERLINEGLMQPSGLKLVNEAKADGRWERAYEPASTMKVPDDFIDLIKQKPNAYAHFKTLSKASLYSIGFKLSTMVDQAKRLKKMHEFVEKISKKELV